MLKNKITTKREQFLVAMQSQNIAEVTRLLEAGVSPNIFIDLKQKLTAIDYAHQIKNDQLYALLVAYGGRAPDITNKLIMPSINQNPIFKPGASKRDQFIHAVLINDLSSLDNLIRDLDNISFHVNADRDTAIHHACRTGNAEMVTVLLQSPNVRLDLKNRNAQSALSIAIASRNKEVLNRLLDHPECQTLIETIYVSADADTVRFLLEACSFLTIGQLDSGMRLNDFNLFQEAINAGAKPRLIHYERALNHPDERFLELMIQTDNQFTVINPFTQENQLLLLARQNKWKPVQAYITTYPLNNLDWHGNIFLLIVALQQRNKAMVDFLLTQKTPLHFLYDGGGVALLNGLREQGEREIIALLVNGAAQDQRLSNYIKLHSGSIPAVLEDYFTDFITVSPFIDPVIAPGGTTCERASLVEYLKTVPSDPFNREPLEEKNLLPNHDVKALIDYYRMASNFEVSQVPPLLKSAVTNRYYKDPVVAANGRTYERAEITEYLRTHYDELPRRSHTEPLIKQTGKNFYPNRVIKLIISEVYLKADFLRHMEQANIPGLVEVINAGFSINTELDEEKNQAIYLIVKQGNQHLLTFFLEQGADAQALNKKGESAFQLAKRLGNETFVLIILKYMAKNKPQELRQLFINQAKNNDVATVQYLLSEYGDKLTEVLFDTINILMDKREYKMVELLLSYVKDDEQLDQIDALLPDVIAVRNAELLTILLTSKISMRSLMSLKAKEVLMNLALDGQNDGAMIEALVTASSTRHVAIAFRIRRLLKPIKTDMMDLDFHDELEELLCDPINFYHFNEPQVTPDGQTFSLNVISGLKENPLTCNALAQNQLRPNLLLVDLIEFLFQARIDQPNGQAESNLVPPMLLSLLTAQPMHNPVIGENGIHYDQAELDDYRAAHKGRMPDNLRSECYPDRTMQSLCEYYNQQNKISTVLAKQGLMGGNVLPKQEPTNSGSHKRSYC